jgi:hypothetical protein
MELAMKKVVAVCLIASLGLLAPTFALAKPAARSTKETLPKVEILGEDTVRITFKAKTSGAPQKKSSQKAKASGALQKKSPQKAKASGALQKKSSQKAKASGALQKKSPQQAKASGALQKKSSQKAKAHKASASTAAFKPGTYIYCEDGKLCRVHGTPSIAFNPKNHTGEAFAGGSGRAARGSFSWKKRGNAIVMTLSNGTQRTARVISGGVITVTDPADRDNLSDDPLVSGYYRWHDDGYPVTGDSLVF